MFLVLTSLAMAASITRAKPLLMAKIIQDRSCHDYSMTSSWPEWDAHADTLIGVSLPDGVRAILRHADAGANESLVGRTAQTRRLGSSASIGLPSARIVHGVSMSEVN